MRANIAKRSLAQAFEDEGAKLDGNMQAVKMILDRILPPKKDSPIAIDIPQIKTASDILQAINCISTAVGQGADRRRVGSVEGMSRRGMYGRDGREDALLGTFFWRRRDMVRV